MRLADPRRAAFRLWMLPRGHDGTAIARDGRAGAMPGAACRRHTGKGSSVGYKSGGEFFSADLSRIRSLPFSGVVSGCGRAGRVGTFPHESRTGEIVAVAHTGALPDLWSFAGRVAVVCHAAPVRQSGRGHCARTLLFFAGNRPEQ